MREKLELQKKLAGLQSVLQQERRVKIRRVEKTDYMLFILLPR